MADLIIGAVSLGAATPGIVVALHQYGKFLHDKIRTFRNAPKTLEDLRRFGHSLYQGQLNVNVELACSIGAQDGIDVPLREALDDLIQELGSELATAKALLDKVDADSIWGRGKLSLLSETKIKKANRRLKEWQSQFLSLVLLIQMKQATQAPEASLLLARERFRLRSSNLDTSISGILGDSNLAISLAEVSDDASPRDINVLVESVSSENKMALLADELEEVASALANTLAGNPSTRGVLKCLGYCLEPTAELVFEIPSNLHEPKTLRHLLVSDSDKPLARLPSIDDRLILARQLSEAVFSVHTAQFVHKRIRPEAILIFQAKDKDDPSEDEPFVQQSSIGVPYLADWQMMRKANALSSRRGDRDWRYGLYRHPRRQGQQPQDRYTLGHDIYSLGVCLLEIGFWDSFVCDGQGEPRPSVMLQQVAQQLFAASVEAKFQRPLDVQRLLLHLAETELPPRMGKEYANLVAACITCLEQGFGLDIDFVGDPTTVGVTYSNFILGAFATNSV